MLRSSWRRAATALTASGGGGGGGGRTISSGREEDGAAGHARVVSPARHHSPPAEGGGAHPAEAELAVLRWRLAERDREVGLLRERLAALEGARAGSGGDGGGG
jgi:hypothetical protein